MPFASWLLELQEIWKHVSAEVAQHQQNKQQSAQETIDLEETSKNKKEKDMPDNEIPSFANIMLQQSEIMDNAEGHKILQLLDKTLIAYHNTTSNPRSLTLTSFTDAKVVLPPLNTPATGVALPTRQSRMLIYLKRNGREEFFGVERFIAAPLATMLDIVRTFD